MKRRKLCVAGFMAGLMLYVASGTISAAPDKTKPVVRNESEKSEKISGQEKADTVTERADTAKEAGQKQDDQESRIRLCVMKFSNTDMPAGVVSAISDSVRAMFSDIGLYTVLSREDVKEDLKNLRKKMPEKCMDTRCLVSYGKLLNVSKIVGGEISNDGTYYAVKINMVDVSTGQSESSLWLASKCLEEKIPELVRAAVFRLHGQQLPKLDIGIEEYRGREFSRHGLLAVTTGFTFAAGLVYALIDGGLTGRDANNVEIPEAFQKTGMGQSSGIPGAFANLGYSARAHAMGDAYIAVSNDATGILWNPAGICRIKKGELAASYLKTVVGIPYVNLEHVNRFSRTGAYGAALLSGGDDTYSEVEVISSFAKLFDNVHKNLRPFAIGVNTRIRTSSYGEKGVGEWRSTGNSFGLALDAGMQFELADYIEMGLVVKNALGFQRWHNTATNKSYNEGVPTICAIGGAFRASQDLLLVMDGYIPVYSDQYYKLSMGVEKIVFNILAFRAGLMQNLAFQENRRITCGFGLVYQGIGCDASYEFAQDKLFSGDTRISTSWKF